MQVCPQQLQASVSCMFRSAASLAHAGGACAANQRLPTLQPWEVRYHLPLLYLCLGFAVERYSVECRVCGSARLHVLHELHQ